MSIEREGMMIVIECDRVGCKETFEIEQNVGFDHGWPRAKFQGWRARKIGRDWVHGCPNHAGDI